MIQYRKTNEVFIMKKFNKSDLKKSGEELQQYLAFRRRGSKVESKKHYSRKTKHKGRNE